MISMESIEIEEKIEELQELDYLGEKLFKPGVGKNLLRWLVHKSYENREEIDHRSFINLKYRDICKIIGSDENDDNEDRVSQLLKIMTFALFPFRDGSLGNMISLNYRDGEADIVLGCPFDF